MVGSGAREIFRSSFLRICACIGLLAGFLASYLIRPSDEELTLVEWYSAALLEPSFLFIVIICTLLGGAAFVAIGVPIRSVNWSSLLPPPRAPGIMAAPRSHPQNNLMHDILTFRRMITPLIIQIIFWLGVAFYVISGFIGLIAGLNTEDGGGLAVLLSLAQIVLAPIAWRIICELLILMFRINETLTDIRNNASAVSPRPLSTPSQPTHAVAMLGDGPNETRQ